MSRQDEILNTISNITENSNTRSKQNNNTKTNSEQLYHLLNVMNESELLLAKKQILSIIERQEHKRREFANKMQLETLSEKEKIDNMFNGL